MSEKEILGALAVLIGLAGNIPYFIGIFKGQIKPHAFSWIIWTVLTAIAAAAQWVDGAGPGMWVTLITSILCFITVLFALKVGDKTDITKTDWIAFVAALSAIPFWYITKNPLGAVIVISVIDFIALYPTLRKGYAKPWEDGISAFAFANVKFIISLFALANFTVITTLYPASIIIANSIFILMILIRRRVIPKEITL